LGNNSIRFTSEDHKDLHLSNVETSQTFFENLDKLKEFGNDNFTISNINDMDKQLNNLLANGSVNETDIHYELMKDLLDDQKKYMVNQDKSLTDIRKHYSAVKSFNTIAAQYDSEEDK
jgi:hypothetical protein